jgi:DNA invertase Pin-like site-specific DNA recombinase
MSKRVAIYTRVSTDEQSVRNQSDELRDVAERRGWEIVAEYSDPGISSSKGREKRPGFDKLLKAATRREIDIVAAWSVDRLGRSLQHLVSFLGDIHGAGVDLYLHQQAIDTSMPAGKALFQMMGVFAEFERSMIVERVNARIKRARRDGTKSGRPFGRPRVDGKTEAAIRKALARGTGILTVAREIGIGTSTVQRIRNETR